jgi:hypothetical protein
VTKRLNLISGNSLRLPYPLKKKNSLLSEPPLIYSLALIQYGIKDNLK